jgi:DinB superfamily
MEYHAMANTSRKTDVYLEIGKKRVLAGAIDWPGWCRGGRDEDEALQALLDYAPRYEQVLRAAHIPFEPPADRSALNVPERLPGNTTTDFGAPDMSPSIDDETPDEAELDRQRSILQACWSALDAAAQAAEGKELRKGPRGGGRDLSDVVRHVMEAEGSYLLRLGGARPDRGGRAPDDPTYIADHRQAILDALGAAVRGEFPPQGPRGGKRWSPRYFVRRAAWHVLDHAWEIQDRAS